MSPQQSSPVPPPLVVVMGVSGSGKSTVGEAIADRLGVPYIDADDLHPPANVAKMRGGTPLTDADRGPWLDTVGAELAAHASTGLVVACSALRRVYRDRLRHHAPDLFLLHLAGDRDVLAERLTGRRGHYMPSTLLDSQIATLEPLDTDEVGATLDVDRPVDELVTAGVAVVPGTEASPR